MNAIIYLLLIAVFIIFVKRVKKCFPKEKYTEYNFTNIIKNVRNIPFYDENNNIIDINKMELDEQIQADKYIEPNDIVLELGARYGTVSCIVNNKLNNKKNHVVVEPDHNVYNALVKNKDTHNCDFHIFDGYISKAKKCVVYSGYSTMMVECDNNKDNDIQTKTLQEIMNDYNLNFNVLIADCESCLGSFLNENLDYIKNYNKIIYEEDQPHLVDYKKIREILTNLGFKNIDTTTENLGGSLTIDRLVWVKT